MFKKILFPTDFSEGSAAAVPYVADLAGKYGAKVYALHVVYDVAKTSGWYVPSLDLETFYAELHASAVKGLDDFVSEHLGGVADLEKAVVSGLSFEEIVKFASEKGIDLVVMGTHGRSGIDRVLFGSTAARVVRSAPCPVMTVRSTARK